MMVTVKTTVSTVCLALCLLLLAATGATAGESVETSGESTSGTLSDSGLFETLVVLDEALFNTFNRCELGRQRQYLDSNIEFYHDKGGLTVTRKKLMRAGEERCANDAAVLRRELVPGSLEVYPIAGYGAIQKGEHRFYLTLEGQAEQLVEIARFVHIWEQHDDGWRITRVLSYDHHAPE